MEYVFVYSHHKERVTQIINRTVKNLGGISMSLDEFVNQPIFDTLSSIQTPDRCFIDRVFGLPDTLINEYQTDDQSHAKFEWYAYLQHHRDRHSRVWRTLDNRLIYKWQRSLAYQYAVVSKTTPTLTTPKHGYVRFGNHADICPNHLIYKSNPYELGHWRPNADTWQVQSNTDYFVESPKGEVINALSIGDHTWFRGATVSQSERDHLCNLLKELNQAQKLDLREFLLFRDHNGRLTFGMYNPIISTAFSDEDIQGGVERILKKN